MESLYLVYIGLCDVDLSIELGVPIRRILQTLGSLDARPVRLVHFVNCDTKHHKVKEDDLGEVIHALAEGEICGDLADLPQALLLDNDAIQGYLEPIANLAERLKKLEAKRLLFLAVRILESAD